MKKIITTVIRFYSNFVSSALVGLFGHSCRYNPTCSKFTIQSIEKYGTIKGTWKGTKRIISCNWFSQKSYYDPI